MDTWILDYIKAFYEGEYFEAEKIKNAHMPSKLYKYQSFGNDRIETLKNSQIYLSHSSSFDDPYDTKGYYINEDEILKTFNKINTSQKYHISANQYHSTIVSLTRNWFEKCWISCFTEEVHNFPMWYYYAGKYEGFCVEYDFSILDNENGFKQAIKPVIYLPEKYDMTKIFECVFDPDKIEKDEASVGYLMHVLGNTIKHESWKFEKEWRYVSFDEDFAEEGKLINNPASPTSIICGKDMPDEHYRRLEEISKQFCCPIRYVEIGDESEKKFII